MPLSLVLQVRGLEFKHISLLMRQSYLDAPFACTFPLQFQIVLAGMLHDLTVVIRTIPNAGVSITRVIRTLSVNSSLSSHELRVNFWNDGKGFNMEGCGWRFNESRFYIYAHTVVCVLNV